MSSISIMIDLPPVLSNKITQFLTDCDNHMLLQTCRAARAIVRHFPRETEYHICEVEHDMYGRYRHLVIWHASNTITCFRYGTFDLLFRMPNDLTTVEFRYLGPVSYGFCLCCCEMEFPQFMNVTTLVSIYSRFPLKCFPKVQNLTIMSNGVNYEYPDWPELTKLEAYDIPHVWPSVQTLETSCFIPPGYTNLKHIDIENILHVPEDAVSNIETINLAVSRINSTIGPIYSDMVVDLENFKSLQEIVFGNIFSLYDVEIWVICSRPISIIHDEIIRIRRDQN